MILEESTDYLKKHFDMIGVDNSHGNVEITCGGNRISGDAWGMRFYLYLLQDERTWTVWKCATCSRKYLWFHELSAGRDGSAAFIVLSCKWIFRRMGIFIFDLNTVYKYKELLGETTIAEEQWGKAVYLGQLLWWRKKGESTGHDRHFLSAKKKRETLS